MSEENKTEQVKEAVANPAAPEKQEEAPKGYQLQLKTVLVGPNRTNTHLADKQVFQATLIKDVLGNSHLVKEINFSTESISSLMGFTDFITGRDILIGKSNIVSVEIVNIIFITEVDGANKLVAQYLYQAGNYDSTNIQFVDRLQGSPSTPVITTDNDRLQLIYSYIA